MSPLPRGVLAGVVDADLAAQRVKAAARRVQRAVFASLPRAGLTLSRQHDDDDAGGVNPFFFKPPFFWNNIKLYRFIMK